MERIISGISTKSGRGCGELGIVFLIVSIILSTFSSAKMEVTAIFTDIQLQYDKEADARRGS